MKSLLSLSFLFLSLGHAWSQSAPYPESEYVKNIHFAPDSTIIRYAGGSDNWPVTWAKDNVLYTTYGDGWGFNPKVDTKLGLGFAKIKGYPPDHKGINIRSAGENTSYGRNGKKGSGILALDSRIYIWLMHADEAGGAAQLAWSDDLLKTVHYADWKFHDFGICSFINFGKNYARARDEYVYMISSDSPRADTPADRFILARVPKDKVVQREHYEFFVRLENNVPVWSKDITARGAVFQHEGNCLRSSLTYNPGLERYIWWQQMPNKNHPDNDQGDTRFEGGFGLYEAINPWGPWRTVFFTADWDVGPGEMANFPAKWMSKDGKVCYMTFSGDDCFSVRKVIFETAR